MASGFESVGFAGHDIHSYCVGTKFVVALGDHHVPTVGPDFRLEIALESIRGDIDWRIRIAVWRGLVFATGVGGPRDRYRHRERQ